MTALLGILLALTCALATNVGFLYKHRGACAAPAVDIRRPLKTARSLFASRLFAIGMLIATGAWMFHVAALAVAPLSLVQSVLAGGMVLLAVMAERVFGLRIGRRQWIGIGLTAVGLMLLGVTLPVAHGAHSRFSLPAMIALEGALICAGTLLVMAPRIGAPERISRLHARRRRGDPVWRLGRRDQGDLGCGRNVRRAGAAEPVHADRGRGLGRGVLRVGQGPRRTATRSR